MVMFHEARYIKSLTDYRDAPEPRPEILLLGRSNVGKSSFINAILNRKNLARTSNTPGKTVTLNYYLVNEAFYFVDAPGYGYARRSHKDRDAFIVMIENHLLHAPMVRAVVLLVDFKVGPTVDDVETYLFLRSLEKEVIVVATKMDKIAKTRQPKRLKEIKAMLDDPIHFHAVSNTTRTNIETVRTLLHQRLIATASESTDV
ncbi:MAG: YihA family ribosome biogenesis GTP-binding protein [Acholeplasmataceae bacterium]|nr:MAG: YihA family ribosome biogenesis GTP-binding protein [Acholeplasmataceae bacterium]